jgi:hypothetical protein
MKQIHQPGDTLKTAQKPSCCGPSANNPDAANVAPPPDGAGVSQGTIYTCPMIRKSGETSLAIVRSVE